MRPVALAEGVEESAYGGKAAQLAAAIRAGLPVPGGLALPAGFVDAVAADQPYAIRKLKEICVSLSGPVAIRSSAVGEDSETASFAGQHLTCLNVRPSQPALAYAVRAIWQSARSESALAYRQRLGLPSEPRIGVVLQELVVAGWPTAIRELAEVCATLDGPVAVRSSAVGEDSETASFAGQHLTCLNVRPSPPALADAVRAIWQSARAEAALAYRRRLGLSSEPQIGVVVQELIVADCAGVLFTRNPFDGADEIVIEASWGLGESIVAGLVTPDRFRLSREGRVLERTPGTKDIEVRVLPEGGTREAEVPAELVRALCLGDKQLRELHALAMRCEKAFGGAQDLEWAFAGGTLYLLQRRAVTSAMKKGGDR